MVDGVPVVITDPIPAKRHGIAILYRKQALAPDLTVAEDIDLGVETVRGGVDRHAMREAAAR